MYTQFSKLIQLSLYIVLAFNIIIGNQLNPISVIAIEDNDINNFISDFESDLENNDQDAVINKFAPSQRDKYEVKVNSVVGDITEINLKIVDIERTADLIELQLNIDFNLNDGFDEGYINNIQMSLQEIDNSIYIYETELFDGLDPFKFFMPIVLSILIIFLFFIILGCVGGYFLYKFVTKSSKS